MSGDTGETVSGPPDVIDRNSGASTVQTGSTTTAFPTAGAYYPFYFYRTGAAATNVGLGFYNSDTNSFGVGTGYISAGFALYNDTGAPLTSFTLSYTVTALTNATSSSDPVNVSYAIGATGVGSADGTYVAAPGLGYSVATGGVVTGPTASTVSGIDVEPGSTLFVRFLDTNISGTDSFSIIDNVQLSALPEPASLGILGLSGLSLVRSRRRA